jgi:hypothetical protein
MCSSLSDVLSWSADNKQQSISSRCPNPRYSAAHSPSQRIHCKRILVRMCLAIAIAELFVKVSISISSRYVTLLFSRRASASSVCSLSLKLRIWKGLPSSGRIEGSLFRTLAQNSRNVDESKALPSSMVPANVESFETLMLPYSLFLKWKKSQHSPIVRSA